MADFNEDIVINIEAQYESLKGLQKQLDDIQNKFKRMGQGRVLKNFAKELEKSADPLKTYSNRLSEAFNRLQTARNKLESARAEGYGSEAIKAQRKERDAARRELQNVIATGQASPALKAQTSAIKTQYAWHNVGKAVKSAGQALGEFARWSQNVEKSTKKSSTWIDKLWGRIRNISIYRIIRTGIKWVTSGFREGLQNFAQYNGEANKTVSDLNTNLKQIRNTMGVSLAYTLQSLQPIIESVFNGITEGLNAFNLALAKMQGKDQFSKAKKNVEDYAKSLDKAKKLSFDVFEVLNSGDSATSPQNMFEDAKIDENESKLSRFFERIFGFTQNISSAIGRILERLSKTDIFDKLLYIGERFANAIADILVSLIDSGAIDTILDVVTDIWDVISKLIGGIAKLIGFLNEIGALKPILLGIASAWGAIKVAALGAVVAQLFAINPFLGTAAAGVLVGSITSLIISAVSKSKVAEYAEGGIPAKSELFYMNENGVPEAFVNTGGSQTNVINIDQLSEGMRRGFVQAIYDTGLIDAVQTRVVVDGNSVNDNAFARAIFPALKTESRRRGGNQL